MRPARRAANIADTERGNLEAIARRERYRWLAEVAAAAACARRHRAHSQRPGRDGAAPAAA
ncbi:MAG: hypothetical protein U0736_00170 [Gemmataceae bacterium]